MKIVRHPNIVRLHEVWCYHISFELYYIIYIFNIIIKGKECLRYCPCNVFSGAC